MGIDFSHCDAHWAYSGFHRFRTKLAKEIGIDLDRMKGFGATWAGETAAGDIEWANSKDDPIISLLDHSDCDGHISPGKCKKIAPRLRELVDKWDDEDYDKQQALLLAEGMELAANERRNLKFH